MQAESGPVWLSAHLYPLHITLLLCYTVKLYELVMNLSVDPTPRMHSGVKHVQMSMEKWLLLFVFWNLQENPSCTKVDQLFFFHIRQGSHCAEFDVELWVHIPSLRAAVQVCLEVFNPITSSCSLDKSSTLKTSCCLSVTVWGRTRA